MKPSAIVYTSNTGFTAQYASLLGGETGLPVYSLEDALKSLPQNSPIVYLGWLTAGKVQGYDKAVTKFNLQALCAVGMAKSGSQMEDVTKSNNLPQGLPLFTLQGGMDRSKLKGFDQMAITMLTKGLAAQKQRSAQDERMLQLLQKDASYVREENLAAVLEWYEKESV